MKAAVLLLWTALSCFGQSFFGAGASFAPSAQPSVAGSGLYGQAIAGTNTHAFVVVDALPTSVKPFLVQTAVATGIAQRVFSIGNISVYTPVAAGISWNGTNTGWNWSWGGLVSIPLKGNFRIMPAVRVLKSSVSDGSGYQPILSVMFGVVVPQK